MDSHFPVGVLKLKRYHYLLSSLSETDQEKCRELFKKLQVEEHIRQVYASVCLSSYVFVIQEWDSIIAICMLYNSQYLRVLYQIYNHQG